MRIHHSIKVKKRTDDDHRSEQNSTAELNLKTETLTFKLLWGLVICQMMQEVSVVRNPGGLHINYK